MARLPRIFYENPVGSGYQGICAKCGHPIIDMLPVEPIFPLREVAALIPCAIGTLRSWIYNRANIHKLGPRIYKRQGTRVPRRYLRAWECQMIRDHMTWTSTSDGKMLRIAEAYEGAQPLTPERETDGPEQTQYPTGRLTARA